MDGAGSIEEALEMMRGMDIYSLGTMEETHFMISGKQSKEDSTFNTVVVELIPDENRHYQLSVIDYKKGDFVDNKPIMTNFHLTGFDGSVESTTRHPVGYERYETLLKNFDQGNTVTGMIELMKKVYFSRAYDLYNENFWYSDYASENLDMTNRGEKNLHGDISAAGAYAKTVQEMVNTYNLLNRSGNTWHTVHTSVYDCENRTLYLVPQESGYPYIFTF